MSNGSLEVSTKIEKAPTGSEEVVTKVDNVLGNASMRAEEAIRRIKELLSAVANKSMKSNVGLSEIKKVVNRVAVASSGPEEVLPKDSAEPTVNEKATTTIKNTTAPVEKGPIDRPEVPMVGKESNVVDDFKEAPTTSREGTNPDEEHIPVEEAECCEKVLHLISELPGKVTTIEHSLKQQIEIMDFIARSVHRLTYEEIPAIRDLLGDAFTNIGEELENTQEDVKKLMDKMGAGRPKALKEIEKQLEKSKEEITSSEAQGSRLVNEVLMQWQAVLTEVEDAMTNPILQTDIKDKIKELQKFIAVRVSEIGSWQKRIYDPLVEARIKNLQKNTTTSMNEALAFAGSIGNTVN